MATITYIEFTGTEHVLDLEIGTSIMQGAVDNNVQGIAADCGGACSCATCHVYVEPEWLNKRGDKSEMEEILVEEVCAPKPNSRLSCQLKVSEALDGLTVRLPESQF